MPEFSPFTYPWSETDVMALLELTDPQKCREFKKNWIANDVNEEPSDRFVRAMGCLYTWRGGNWMHPQALSVFVEQVMLAMQECTKGVLQEHQVSPEAFWSQCWLVVLPTGDAVLTDNPMRAIPEMKASYPDHFGRISAYVLIDIGEMVRLMTDYLALKAIGV